MIPRVEISARAAERLRNGHVWVYQSDVREAASAAAGDIVLVMVKHRGGGLNPVGTAFYNPRSLITLRLFDRAQVQPDSAYWRGKLAHAIALRERWRGADTVSRLVYSEADDLSGLVVDRYGDVVVLQTQCAGTDRLKPVWVALINELLSPRAIVERNDTGSRRLEGLPDQKGVIAGALEGPVEVADGGLTILVDPLEGQKTGYYLDQRENRKLAADLAHGRCLDVFCYQGGFGLQLKRGGAAEVTLVDQSEPALKAALETARRNGLTLQTQAANAFDFLHDQQARGERYDVVVLDPPAFAKNKKAVEAAARGYKEINLRAMRLLAPGGFLITSSCSYHMEEGHFEQILTDAAQDVGRTVQVLERRTQARDHPVRLGFPESRYLKCFFLRVL